MKCPTCNNEINKKKEVITWHKYPEIQPPDDISHFLITVKDKRLPYQLISITWRAEGEFTGLGDYLEVLSWAIVPEGWAGLR